jgi:hypothetical protein
MLLEVFSTGRPLEIRERWTASCSNLSIRTWIAGAFWLAHGDERADNRLMRFRLAGLLAVALLAFLAPPANPSAPDLDILAVPVPKPGPSVISSLRLMRVSDGILVASDNLHGSQSLSVPSGVFVATAEVVRWRAPRTLAAAQGAIAKRGHVTRLSLRLSSRAAGASGRVAAAASGNSPVIASQGVALTGAPGSDQPRIPLDGAIGGYLFDALSPEGVRVLETSPVAVAAARREQKLSEEGLLDTPVRYQPLSPSYFVHGEGTIRKDGKVSLQLRVVDSEGVIVALVNASGKGTQLRSVLITAVKKLAAAAAPHLRKPAPRPVKVIVDVEFCGSGSDGRTSTVTASPSGTASSIQGPGDTDQYEWSYSDSPITITLTAQPGPGCGPPRWQYDSGSLWAQGTCRDTQDYVSSCTVIINPRDYPGPPEGVPTVDVLALFSQAAVA